MKTKWIQTVIALVMVAMNVGVVAAWQENGIPVSAGIYYQEFPRAIVSDGTGGALLLMSVAYWDEYTGPRGEGMINRKISPNGDLLWWNSVDSGGAMLSDGLGGAFIAGTVNNYDSFPLLTEHHSAEGGVTQVWTADYEYLEMNDFPDLTSDGAGGVIVAWRKSGGATNGSDIWAQRHNSSCAELWGPGGIAVCDELDDQWPPQVTSDGANGAIICWASTQRKPNGQIEGYNPFVQRIDPAGLLLWGTGIRLSLLKADQRPVVIVTGGAGGAIVAWQDDRNGDIDIYAQRVDPNGALLWAVDGVAVCDEAGNSVQLSAVSDGVGGAIVVWHDDRNVDSEIYAQRIDADGNHLWTSGGVLATNHCVDQSFSICTDGIGGVIVAWTDDRGVDSDIFAQRFDPTGAELWWTSGLPVCTETDTQYKPIVAPDGTGGAIIAWADRRSDVPYAHEDVYAQRIYGEGVPAAIDPDDRQIQMSRLFLHQNHPNPFNPSTTIAFTLPNQLQTRLSIYNIEGKEVATLVDQVLDGGLREVTWNGRDDRGNSVSSGVYFYRLTAGNQTLTKKMIFLK